MKYVANKNNKANDNKLKLFALLVFLCTSNDVFAYNPSCIKKLSILDIVFNEKMLFLLILAILIIRLILKINYDKDVKRKKAELNNIGVKKIEDREASLREEFDKLEEKFESIRATRNLRVPTTPEEEADLNKTVVLSKIVLDIDPDRLEKLTSKTGASFDDDTSNNVILSQDAALEKVEAEADVELLNDVETSEKVEDVKIEDEDYRDEETNDYSDELEEEEEKQESEEETDSLNDNVKKIGKSVKNIVDKTLELKKREILEFAICIHENIYSKEMSRTVINTFVREYVTFKYLKQIEHEAKNAKYLRKLVNSYLETVTNKLISNVHRSYTDEYIRRVFDMFIVINKIDCMDANIDKVILECDTLDIISKEELSKKLKNIYKMYFKIYLDYLKKLDIDKFKLVSTKLETNGLFEPGNLVMTNISSSIQFSKIFSDYIIDKTYNSDIITEDLREVQLKLISFNILEDMLHFNYKKKYIINFPVSLYKKEKKIQSLLNAVGDGYSQNKIFILIDMEVLKECNEMVLKLKRQGFKFIIQVTSENIKLYDDVKKQLSLVEYIVYAGPRIGKTAMKGYVPSYLLKKIIYVDKNIVEGVVIK